MKIPVYTINGFLGSGKTTILLAMMEECKRNGWKAGIILNELGEKNIEEDYFEGQNLKQLLDGCICCTMQDGLQETLRSIAAEPINILLIEGTGVANPLAIERTLISAEFRELFDLYSMISVVDASKFLEYRNRFASSREIRQLLQDQMTSAKMVVVNKTDLAKPSVLAKVEKKMENLLHPDTPVFRTAFGKLDSTQLFRRRYTLFGPHAQASDRVHSHHQAVIRSIRIQDVPAMTRETLIRWIEQLPLDVLRGKGLVRLLNEPGTYLIQFSSGELSLERMKEDGREPVIILIGEGLQVEAMNRRLLEHAKADSVP
ncbi:hypothetical protein CSV74_06060 [Sporosarcina sp. P19]|uniref:CobW family GTP-binding protein n=1 Tax=Sporosarcina sp. P19 TaxID=2048258 RepID=UPI000C1631A8|nr:GTP-binding protein [Sporosarcina sp. P19]PIC77643.1 hypothetical protein CSV74_06060 [Sporosarcina sp. P19]